ncbi:MAG: hypothetical protein ACLURP_01055 [Ruminococcus sp.]
MLDLNNDGVAPLYKKWPVYLYLEDPSEIQWRRLKSICFFLLFYQIHNITRTVFETRDIPALLKEGYALSVGIEDPMTEKPGVRLAMECAYQNWQKYTMAEGKIE